jgi:hypothetical protein
VEFAICDCGSLPKEEDSQARNAWLSGSRRRCTGHRTVDPKFKLLCIMYRRDPYSLPEGNPKLKLIQGLNYRWRATIIGRFGGPAFRYQDPNGAFDC